MPFQKGNPGRKKGSQNKFTVSVKSAFQAAFDEMGGQDALAKWGALNQTEFYKLASKLIPQTLEGGDKPIDHSVTVNFK